MEIVIDPWSGREEPLMYDDPNLTKRFEDSFIPHQRLPDSESYLLSLESKLARIKGKNREPTCREIISTMQSVRDDHLSHLIDDSFMCLGSSSFLPEGNIGDEELTPSYLERKIFPEKNALSKEELQYLLEADVLERSTSEMLESSSGVKNDVCLNTSDVPPQNTLLQESKENDSIEN